MAQACTSFGKCADGHQDFRVGLFFILSNQIIAQYGVDQRQHISKGQQGKQEYPYSCSCGRAGIGVASSSIKTEHT